MNAQVELELYSPGKKASLTYENASSRYSNACLHRSALPTSCQRTISFGKTEVSLSGIKTLRQLWYNPRLYLSPVDVAASNRCLPYRVSAKMCSRHDN